MATIKNLFIKPKPPPPPPPVNVLNKDDWDKMAKTGISESAYNRAVEQCRLEGDFFFCDLPQKTRVAIYKHLFSNTTICVCSYLKDHKGEFTEGDRCQILLTCKSINKEASPYFYSTIHFEFISQPRLDYFLWWDVAPEKHELVQKITLTKRELVLVFDNYIKFFSNLKALTIDFPCKIRRQTPLRPADHRATAKFVKTSQWYHNWVGAYLPEPQGRSFSISVVVQLLWTENGVPKSEMCCVDVDRLRVQQNYRPVPPPEILHTLHMPSADDSDVEIQEVASINKKETDIQS